MERDPRAIYSTADITVNDAALTSTAAQGVMIIDDISVLNLSLKGDSSFMGAINPDGAAGDVYVELTDSAKWTLTADSYRKSLTCAADSIDLNGYTLTVDGKAYSEGSESSGEAIEIPISEGKSDMTPPDGKEFEQGKMPQSGEGMQPPSDGKKPENRKDKDRTEKDRKNF